MELQIIILKMKAIQLAFSVFLHRITGEILILMSDNAMVVAYLKKQGGTASLDLCRLAQEITARSELHMVNMMARYIPGKKNTLAAQLSHSDEILPMNWSLP